MAEPTKFQDLSAEDFAEAPASVAPQAAPVAKARVEVTPLPTAKDIEPSWLKRGLAGTGQSFVNKYRGLTGQSPAEDMGLSSDTAASLGGLVPDVLGSILAPARVIPQALYGVGTKFIEPADNVLERTVAGLKGGAEAGAGQAVASGIVKAINRAGGNLTKEGALAAIAKERGLNLSAGDIMNSKLMRLAEEKSFGSPTARQADEVAALMTDKTGDPITNAIRNAYESAQGRVSDASTRLDALVSQGGMPKVVPRKTYEMIQEIAKRSPDTLNNVRDPQLRQILDEMATYPAGRIPKGTSFTQLDELRKALGPIMAKVETQSQSGASNINTADAGRWKQLYKGIMTDIEDWGGKSVTADALAAHKELSSTFKNDVLPLREHPVAGKVLDDGYARPEDLLRDLTSVRNKSIINDLYGRLDEGGRNAFDALRSAQRGSREFVKGEASNISNRPLTQAAIGATAMSPWVPGVASAFPWLAGGLAAEQGLVHGLNTPVGKAILSGSPEIAKSPLANAAAYSGVRNLLPAGVLRALGLESQQK